MYKLIYTSLLLFCIFNTAFADDSNFIDKCKTVNKLSLKRNYFYKIEPIENIAVKVYLSHEFYDLKYDMRDVAIQCVFIEHHAKHNEVKAIILHDDRDGKFIGIYTPEKGLTLNR